MADRHNPKLRFGIPLDEALTSSFQPSLANAPPLPAVDYGLVGKQAPKLLPTPSGKLPKAATVVITWAEAEWAALQHVFCAGGSAMPYSERSRGSWAGWEKYSHDLPPAIRPTGPTGATTGRWRSTAKRCCCSSRTPISTGPAPRS